MLRKGTTGEAVKVLQVILNVLQTGIFDNNTELAVKLWQKKNGLLDDGVVGPKTWGAMFPLTIEAYPVDLNVLRTYIPDAVIIQIPQTAKKFGITTGLRLAHFLAQCAHESGNFKAVYENLNYSADGLMRVFKHYFPTLALAQNYQYKPELIASRVYGSRMGNGNETTKEGYLYRGRGYLQLTGKNNYRLFDAFIDDDIIVNPDLVATKYPLMSAAWYFHANNLFRLCDDVNNVGRVTLAVNGGYNGLDDRQKKFELFNRLLS
jgi:putative chitinase